MTKCKLCYIIQMTAKAENKRRTKSMQAIFDFVETLLNYLGEFKAADIVGIVADLFAKFGISLL